MTAQEIVQALRCCANGESEDCPFAGQGVCGCPGLSADLIERLTAENAALREKVPQWVSVEDRLPEPGARVIVTDGVFVGEWYKAVDGTWNRYSGVPIQVSIGRTPTHWMPLPDAPEGGKHE